MNTLEFTNIRNYIIVEYLLFYKITEYLPHFFFYRTLFPLMSFCQFILHNKNYFYLFIYFFYKLLLHNFLILVRFSCELFTYFHRI